MKNIRFVRLLALAALAAPSFAQMSLTGAGATFPFPIYSKWFNEYQKMHKDIQINYQSLGSGAGIRQVTEGTVDFGASDVPMTDGQIKAFQDKRHMNILHFPTVLGSNVPAYNLPGVSVDLKFTGELLADIFLDKVTKWNDPAIAKLNPGVKLPSNDIIPVHRADASGTTGVWTDYLMKVSPAWSSVGKGASVNWPGGLAAKGSEGMTGLLKQTPYSIGYVELVYAIQNHMGYGAVRNKAGKFVKADLASTTAAAAGINMPDDFRISITDAPGADAYPIATFTYLLIPEKIDDQKKLQVIKDVLTWMLGPGQKMTAVDDYAPLPASVVAKERKALEKVH